MVDTWEIGVEFPLHQASEDILRDIRFSGAMEEDFDASQGAVLCPKEQRFFLQTGNIRKPKRAFL